LAPQDPGISELQQRLASSIMARKPRAITDQVVVNHILVIRGTKVMLDADLAELYGVDNKQLKRQVRRNSDRFPEDFMFELTIDELKILRSHSGTSRWGGTRYPPMAFTEQGVAMLSSVLNSPRAIQVNVRIIRIFTRMRELVMTHKDILLKLEKLEHETSRNRTDLQKVFKTLKQMLRPPTEPRKRIGYKTTGDE